MRVHRVPIARCRWTLRIYDQSACAIWRPGGIAEFGAWKLNNRLKHTARPPGRPTPRPAKSQVTRPAPPPARCPADFLRDVPRSPVRRPAPCPARRLTRHPARRPAGRPARLPAGRGSMCRQRNKITPCFLEGYAYQNVESPTQI